MQNDNLCSFLGINDFHAMHRCMAWKSLMPVCIREILCRKGPNRLKSLVLLVYIIIN